MSASAANLSLAIPNLSQDSLRNLSQEDQIAAAQDMLLAELSGTIFRVNGRFRYVPGTGLSVDPKGLTSLVKAVNEDALERAH